jgi:hypothetical protein
VPKWKILITALRTFPTLVDEGVVEAEDVCVFEATERVDGRIYSLRGFGPERDLMVDAGAYRTWPEFMVGSLFLRMYLVRTFCNLLTNIVFPLSIHLLFFFHRLMTEKLGLKMSYDEEEEPGLKYNIVDDNDQKIGFATFVETMMSQLIDQGACFYPRHELKQYWKSLDVRAKRQTNRLELLEFRR